MTEGYFRLHRIGEIALARLLAERERRAGMQRELSEKYGCPILSFTMNIAGPIKSTPLVTRAFHIGLSQIRASLGEKILFEKTEIANEAGPLSLLAVREDAQALKRICVSIEEKTPMGRLFDMDVIDEGLHKLDRPHERGCIVCGAPGRACAAGRLHPLSEITKETERRMAAEVFAEDCEKIACLAKDALIREVRTTPKPGLVDRNNNGSHKDMSVPLFEKSAEALKDYFAECIKIGAKCQSTSPSDCLSHLRTAGRAAEEKMRAATEGVNTHKGAIFSFGLLCGAIGRLWQKDLPIPNAEAICAEAASLAEGALREDLRAAEGKTAGERMFLHLGLSGIRGEAAEGFPSVRLISLPVYRRLLAEGRTENESGAIALIHLIARVNDTAIYNRGGKEGLDFAKSYAAALTLGGRTCTLNEIFQADLAFTEKNLSPGGSADLLAVTYFLHSLELCL